MQGVVKRYRWFAVMLLALAVLTAVSPALGADAVAITGNTLVDMLMLLPPILLFVGLLDVWVPKETMIKYMGAGSGVVGVVIAFLLGAISAGPLYLAFPIAAMLIKKGALIRHVVFFLGVWTVAKLPVLIYELAALGALFTAIHVGFGLIFFYVLGLWFERQFDEKTLLKYDITAESA
ncbi:permease [Salisediminibacterium halotolerans]|uniref:Predicted permease n=1 Tax=Salisediminibacterium halotolerans TaxID=517425 RepID=A0A1H9QJN7_9BACI|nr:permease [Salisediminibacterium haloalkalitolerans]SER60664.1 Predicted permease [Salisediminibacterium haloalkalitolerans]